MAHQTEEVLRLTNGVVDVEVSTAFGPRVLRYGYSGGRNVLGRTPPDTSTATPFGPWFPVGGHRLWVAPERMPGSYAPDRHPVACTAEGPCRARFHAPTDAAGIEKVLRVDVDPSGTGVLLTHTITNRTCWPARIAPWAITIVDPDGTALVPQPAFRSHADDFLPARPMVQWRYTDLSDTRWRIGRHLIALTPDGAKQDAQKIGVANAEGWCAVAYRDCTFVKTMSWIPGAPYPDIGCNTELFTAGAYLEVETLAPLAVVEPGASASHEERWFLLPAVVGNTDEQRAHAIADALAHARSTGDTVR